MVIPSVSDGIFLQGVFKTGKVVTIVTKIDIISGFLGAGKTTLIKKLLSEAFQDEKVVLIENEFGEIGIDGGFLKDAGVEITEMNSGCICCSLVGDFGTALEKVIHDYTPDRVIIEPSGVGKLSDVIRAVEGVGEKVDIKLNSYTAVVDGQKCKMYMKNFGEFFNNQIEHAKTIVLSRTQKMSEEKLAKCLEMIKEHNPKATIVTTAWDDIDGAKILDAMEKENDFVLKLLEEEHEHHHDHEHHHHDHDDECCHDHDHEHHHHHDGECGCGHHHHHHADEVFTSWGKETVKSFDREEMEKILKELSENQDYGIVLRAKGMVSGKDGHWIYFDMVPEEYEIREGAPEYTGRICVIGSKLNEEKLEELFAL